MVNLRKIRKKAGLTQKELASECGVVRQAITNIENGIALPSVNTAKAIGQTLGFNWTLFFEEGGNDERISN